MNQTILTTSVRSKMSEQKICSLTIKNGSKLNLLLIGSEYLPFPVYLVRLNRKEVFNSTNYVSALNVFGCHCREQIGLLNQIPFEDV